MSRVGACAGKGAHVAQEQMRKQEASAGRATDQARMRHGGVRAPEAHVTANAGHTPIQQATAEDAAHTSDDAASSPEPG